MAQQRFGKSDPDVQAKGSKEKGDKEGLRASTRLPTTGKVGGISNRVEGPSASKKSGGYPAFRRGGRAKR
jgi:hypothetical protein